MTGSPDPPPAYRSVRVFPEAKFDHPLQITRCPGSDRLFITEEKGKIYSLRSAPDARPELFFDLPQELQTIHRTADAKELEILYALVFHPKFVENRYCYLNFSLKSNDPKKAFLPDGARISRFKVTDTDPPRLDPSSEEIIITWQSGGHNGCDLHFGPRDGLLYASIGDGRGPNPPDPLNTGQDCSDLLSSVLRIDVDRRDGDKNYSIPADNPFVGWKDVRPEIWAFGFRNPYRMSFDRQTGDLWVGDVGWELWEMVHKIQRGGNYGWSVVEGRQATKPDHPVGPTPILPPTIELPHTIAASVTGGYVYRGQKFPELAGAYIFGDWETRRIWAARVADGRVQSMPEIVKPNVRVSAFGEDHAGEIYYVDYDTGFLYTLARQETNQANAQFPTTLQATGLFRDVRQRALADGVLAFNPAVRQWQDGARAAHWLALPGLGAVTVFDKPRKLTGQVHWHDFRMKFPNDAVLVKHLSLDLVDRGQQPIETQLLHFDGEDWHGYTYAWRDDGSDADLVPADGSEKTFLVRDERLPSGRRELTWTYHSRNQCTVCHNSWSEYALAFSLGQLNAPPQPHGAASAGGGPTAAKSSSPTSSAEHELVRLSRLGVITRVGADDQPLPPFDAETAAKERSFAASHREGSALQREVDARAYLHVNCAHCHRFGGGGGQVVLEMDFSKPLKETGFFDVPPRQGDFGLPDARIVKPGDPYGSVLFYRMLKAGRGRMPHLGSEVPDGRGLEIIARWIEGAGESPTTNSPAALANVPQQLASPRDALQLARRLAHPVDRPSAELISSVVGAASKLPAGPVRELFEGYFPPDPRGRRLGANPKPAAILSLAGDAQRGAQLFTSNTLKCNACHKVGEQGVELGPNLSTIGQTRTRDELLDSLLHPSAKIDPKYATFLIETHDGKVRAGLITRRDDRQLVVRDAENKEHALRAEDVERVRPSRTSLMPEGVLNSLLPQEAADLLEYLATRRK